MIPQTLQAIGPLVGVGMLFAALTSPVRAASITDPVNDFLPTYTAGPQAVDLDIVAAEVSLSGDRLLFSGTLNGQIGTTPNVLYVFGLDRGQGTPIFAADNPPVGSNVLFDAALVLFPANNLVFVDDLIAGTTTTLSPSDFTVSGNEIVADLPLSLFPSQGRAAAQYTFNLWTRFLVDGSNDELADFAPDNSNAEITVVPEPSSVVGLCVTGVLALSYWMRGRNKIMTGG